MKNDLSLSLSLSLFMPRVLVRWVLEIGTNWHRRLARFSEQCFFFGRENLASKKGRCEKPQRVIYLFIYLFYLFIYLFLGGGQKNGPKSPYLENRFQPKLDWKSSNFLLPPPVWPCHLHEKVFKAKQGIMKIQIFSPCRKI